MISSPYKQRLLWSIGLVFVQMLVVVGLEVLLKPGGEVTAWTILIILAILGEVCCLLPLELRPFPQQVVNGRYRAI